MQTRRFSNSHRGFFFLMTLFMLIGLLSLTLVGVSRSMTEISAANWYIASTEAFHLAEAGLDAALRDSRLQQTDAQGNPLTQSKIDTLVGTQLITAAPLGSGTYTVDVQDQNGATTSNSDDIVVLVATGRAPLATSRQVRTTVRLPLGGVSPVFNYVVAVSRELDLSGNAVIGDSLNRPSLYVAGSELSGGVTTTSAVNVWASSIDFLWDPAFFSTTPTISQLCQNCSNGSIFHQPTTFNIVGPGPGPTISMDLNPYYAEALQEQSAAEPYHHITTATTFANATLHGVIYVESEATITFKGNCTVNGTIVHEGQGGQIKIASQGNLTIDSWSGTQFAKGLAIIGQPVLNFPNTSSFNITGFVMDNAQNYDGTWATGGTLAGSGTIRGGLIGVHMDMTDNYFQFNIPGPGHDGAVQLSLFGLQIGGGAQILFQGLPGAPIGFSTAGGTTTPQILLWSAD